MKVSSIDADGILGVRSENTIDALKKHLGVERLELVVLNSLTEYRELLVEVDPPRRWNWKRTWFVVVVTLVVYQTIAYLVGPVPRLDEILDTGFEML